MRHLLILLRHPWPGKYPKKRDIAWLMRHAQISQDEVLWWKTYLKAKTKPQRLQPLGETDKELIRMARLVRMFTQSRKIRTGVSIGLGQRPRFERFPRRRIVLGSGSLIEALHEIGHSRYGRSEAIAVAWSVAMFFKVTSGSLNKAKWYRHTLANEQDFLRQSVR